MTAFFWAVQARGHEGSLGEIGNSDFRISHTPGWKPAHVEPNYDSAIAYNSLDDEFLVVWNDHNFREGCDPNYPFGQREIFAQRLSGQGELLGDQRKISTMTLSCNTAFFATQPALAYNSVRNEYLVVWSGSKASSDTSALELEVYGQRLNAFGEEIGGDDFRISDAGPYRDSDFDATSPDVAFNPLFNQFLVVWQAQDDAPGFHPDEVEVFGQFLSGVGNEIGTNDFRVSDLGGTGDPDFYPLRSGPTVAYNDAEGGYLVVWAGNDDVHGLDAGDFEVFGQRFGAGGAELGSNDFLVSSMGGIRAEWFASAPEVESNGIEYLVIWEERSGSSIGIYAQRLNALGEDLGEDDFQVWEPPIMTAAPPSLGPDLSWNTASGEWLVSWHTDFQEQYSREVFYQRLNEFGSMIDPVGIASDSYLLSEDDFLTGYPAVAARPIDGGEYLLTWLTGFGPRGPGGYEMVVFGQRLGPVLFADSFESGTTGNWTSAPE